MSCENCGGCDCKQRNPDEGMREMERRASMGDPLARRKLRIMRKRADIRLSGPRLAFEMVRREGVWRVDLENCLREGPPSHAVPTFWDDGRVFWSENYNSYVLVIPQDDEQGQFWHETEGQVNLYSVNGSGEVRWDVTAFNAENAPEGGFGGEGAAQAFGLID